MKCYGKNHRRVTQPSQENKENIDERAKLSCEGRNIAMCRYVFCLKNIYPVAYDLKHSSIYDIREIKFEYTNEIYTD